MTRYQQISAAKAETDKLLAEYFQTGTEQAYKSLEDKALLIIRRGIAAQKVVDKIETDIALGRK